MGDWIYGIVAVMLFGMVILQITPEGSYQQYVRLFLGALLMLTVLSPVFSLLGLSEGTRLSAEQDMLLAWWGTDSVWQENEWTQQTDHWEDTMRQQLLQKQETWVKRSLEEIAQEYGFVCLAQEVEWDANKNWPQNLTLWLAAMGELPEEEIKKREETAGGTGAAMIDLVDAVDMKTPVDSGTDAAVSGETYYEPSELRPLHQALQVIWQLGEEQILLYCTH